MLITVKRFLSNSDETLGHLSVDGELICFTLEDEKREIKVADETRIPAGTYDVRLRNDGGVTKKYASKFPNSHKGMLWLQNVPGFTWIYIHMGNTDDHTSGCVLVAEQARIDGNGRMTSPSSQRAYERLYKLASDAAENCSLQIEILDEG